MFRVDVGGFTAKVEKDIELGGPDWAKRRGSKQFNLES
jgi:hypothetical protein